MGEDDTRGRRRPAGAHRLLAVEVVTPRGARAPGLARWLERVAPSRARGQVTVALVSDARVRALNRRYRGIDATTDVLSFPAAEPRHLGDIVIAAGVARRQARDAGHAVGTELRVLALHGLLHLLGYDHEHDDGRMARMERRLRRRGGLEAGLIERDVSRQLSRPLAPRTTQNLRPAVNGVSPATRDRKNQSRGKRSRARSGRSAAA